MVVFVVQEYRYDDSKVHGVWSSFEGAEEYVKVWMSRAPHYHLECNIDILTEEVQA